MTLRAFRNLLPHCCEDEAMPMMRRGPLDRYSPEWVLRQADAHLAEGSIEFHTDRPVTLYLQGGRAYAAEEGVNVLEQGLTDRPLSGEQEARDRVVALLSEVLATTSGWYSHDPLGQHPSRGSWTWSTATLLMETRAKAHQTSSLAAETDRSVVLLETASDRVTLGSDAWSVVVRLAGSVSATDLRTQLGWSPERVANALAEMDACGVLEPTSSWRPPAPAAEIESGTDHRTGALAPPTADPSSPRRRGLHLRRTNGS